MREWVRVPLSHIPEGAKIEGESSLIPRNVQNVHKIIFDEQADVLTWSEKEIKQLCKDNDIPLGWVTGRFPHYRLPKPRSFLRRFKRKRLILATKERQAIFKELRKLCKPVELIIQILWFLNKKLQEGTFISLKELLGLQPTGISQNPRTGIVMITLSRYSMNGPHLVSHYLNRGFGERLLKQAHHQFKFVFTNKYHGPISREQVDAYLKKAAKKAGIQKPVSSLSFRPFPERRKKKRLQQKKASQAQGNCMKNYLTPNILRRYSGLHPANLRLFLTPNFSDVSAFNIFKHIFRTREKFSAA